MSVSTINNFLNTDYKLQLYSVGQDSTANAIPVSKVEPVNPIISKDILDINFDKVNEYKAKFDPIRQTSQQDKSQEKSDVKDTTSQENKTDSSKQKEKTPVGKELSQQEEKAVESLKKRDTEVRQHEQAHMAAGGNLVRGGASYSYSVGPDGKQYAIGGEVNIDMSPEEDPQKTIVKMQKVIAAAMAPAEPSGQDYAVASAAKRNEAEARQQMAKEKQPNSGHSTVSQTTDSKENTTKQSNTATVNSGKLAYQNGSNTMLKKRAIGLYSNNTPSNSTHNFSYTA